MLFIQTIQQNKDVGGWVLKIIFRETRAKMAETRTIINRRPVNRTGYKEHVNGSMKAKAIRQQEHGKQQQEHSSTKEQRLVGTHECSGPQPTGVSGNT